MVSVLDLRSLVLHIAVCYIYVYILAYRVYGVATQFASAPSAKAPITPGTCADGGGEISMQISMYICHIDVQSRRPFEMNRSIIGQERERESYCLELARLQRQPTASE